MYKTVGIKLKSFFTKFLIKQNGNRKLETFRLFVAFAFYVDFFLTGFILSNYELLQSYDHANDYFLDHNSVVEEAPIYTKIKIKDFMNY
jgi:hypothetical protein